MNKADLIDAVATKTGLGKTQASSAVESFLDVISEALTRGESVSLVGFGILVAGNSWVVSTVSLPLTSSYLTFPGFTNGLVDTRHDVFGH